MNSYSEAPLATAPSSPVQPWYREFWAWFILSPLIVVVITCSITVTLAVRNADDPVVDNYYQQGRMINLRMDEKVHAYTLGLQATLDVDRRAGLLSIRLAQSSGVPPEQVYLELSHPAQMAQDQSWLLDKNAQGIYQLALPAQPLVNRWYLRLRSVYRQEAMHNWRLQGEIDFSQQATIVLRADG
ncbi:MAG: FixH family protein [Cellvibrionaceae bacterium]|nr:FixH family protein [Cellvibrionaceae bacterium]